MVSRNCKFSHLRFCEVLTAVYLQYDGADVSVNQPPNTLSFDPAKQKPSLIPGGRPSINPTTPAPSGGGELVHVASILSDLRSMISSTRTPPVTPIREPVTPVIRRSPSEPTQPTATSPTPYTPSLLSRFLRYSQEHLGVCNATSYENALLRHGYGPDILHKVPSKDLENLDISAGDVIRLKEASLPWFTGPLAKRKRGDDVETETQGASRPPPAKKRVVRYERRWFTAAGNPDGASQFFGGPMVEGDPPEVGLDGLVMEVWYFCEARNDWAEIPLGLVAVEEADPF